jgi:hypothetical protein
MPVYSGELETAPEGQDISSLGPTSFGTMVGARARQAVSESPTAQLFGLNELAAANGMPPDLGVPGVPPPAELTQVFQDQPDIPIEEARSRVKSANLDSIVHLPDQPTMKAGALDIMINRARDDQERQAKIAEGPGGFLAGAFDVGTSLAVSAVDPLNLAVGMIPIMGEARYGKMLAGAGENLFTRAAVRGGVGAAQGAMFSTVMTPLDWLSHTQEGRDYGMNDALRSILYGAGTFGLMHVAGGAAGDIGRMVRGRALYPFGPGEPHDAGVPTSSEMPHVGSAESLYPTSSAESLLEAPAASAATSEASWEAAAGGASEAPADHAEVGGEAASGEPQPTPALAKAARLGESVPLGTEWNPVDILPDLPPRVNEDLMRGAIAAMAEGKKVPASEMLEIGAQTDPRIADALDTMQAGAATAAPDLSSTQILKRPGARMGPAARDPDTYSLLEFLARQGGLAPHPDLESTLGKANKFIPGFGSLVRKTGMSLDRAREAAVEAGYIHDAAAIEGNRPTESTVNDLMEAIETEERGQKVYRAGAEHLYRLEERMDGDLREFGVDPETVPYKTRARVLEIMDKEAVADPLVAYERAVMEESHYGAQDERTFTPEYIPGWDVPPEPGPALGRGGGPAGAGQSDLGAAAREPGAGDSGAGSGAAGRQLAAERSWYDLANRPEPADDPAAVAAQRSVEALPEPPAVTPSKSLKFAEQLAAEAEERYRAEAEYMNPDERAAIDAALAEIDRDSTAKLETIRLGAACLAAAGL